jgi:hypothetical protein
LERSDAGLSQFESVIGIGQELFAHLPIFFPFPFPVWVLFSQYFGR